MAWRGLQPYAGQAFKKFFKLSGARGAATESARLQDLVTQVDGLPVPAQRSLLRAVEQARAKERPPPYDADIEAYRKHNSSLMRLEGQCVYGRIVRSDPKFVWVDIGYKSVTRINKRELNFTQLVASHAGGGQRRGANDFRVGDVLTFLIEDLETPFGDMVLTAPGQIGQTFDINKIWATLEDHLQSNTPVRGRVLNATRGGYAVGFGGLIGFCPFTRCSVLTASRIGILQPFFVEVVDQENTNLVLADQRMRILEERRQQSKRRSFDFDDPGELDDE